MLVSVAKQAVFVMHLFVRRAPSWPSKGHSEKALCLGILTKIHVAGNVQVFGKTGIMQMRLLRRLRVSQREWHKSRVFLNQELIQLGCQIKN